ncbi:hypothetical protein LDENG_00288190 [Lucifuga dentata]|nr:hypothetical protein LDENG_00288190 [Lucifuga dentata]
MGNSLRGYKGAADDSTPSTLFTVAISGKLTSGDPEKNQGMRVVLDVTDGLRGHNVTCDNFFTSYELGQQLLKRKITMVGTETSHHPGLQPQQRGHGQPGQGDRNLQLQEEDCRWPLVIFHNIIDVSSYNAFVIWNKIDPNWIPGKRHKRRMLLEQLGKALVTPYIQRREHLPRTAALQHL